MNNRILLLLSLVFLLSQACEQQEELLYSEGDFEQMDILSREQLKEVVFEKLNQTGDFEWNDLNDEQLASAFLLSDDKLITVAWDYESQTDKEKTVIIDFINQSEGTSVSGQEVIVEVNDNLKILDAKIEKVETLLGLRQLEETVGIDVYFQLLTDQELERLANAYATHLKTQENSGIAKSMSCSSGNNTPFMPEASCNHDVPAAWNAGLTGDGIKVAVVDGALNSFDGTFGRNRTGGNNNRTLQTKSWYKTPWWSFFRSYQSVYGNIIVGTHGTSMTKAIGNPPGGSAGVAYNADLFFVRSTGAPLTILIDAPSENTVGVRKSLEYLATRSDVKIISMSQGGVVSWWGVKRAVRMCNDSGKLIFFAGGTFIAGESLSDLIFGSPSSFTLFPARLSFDSNEDDFEFVFSVTGIEPTNNVAEASWCPECFGRADFVVEFSNGGSSSHSTSHTAGMAALIWSDNVNQTREQVLAKMIAASDRSTANRSPDFGYGRVNMQQYLDIR